MEEKNFGYLGFSFQQSLVKAIIEDKKYGETIIDVLESKFFENVSFRFIMEHMKEYKKDKNEHKVKYYEHRIELLNVRIDEAYTKVEQLDVKRAAYVNVYEDMLREHNK